MRYQLDFVLRRAEGVLPRVLGATERRGFRPLSVDGEAGADGEQWRLRVTVEGERADTTLQAQLSKLYDCLSVQVQPCP
ncbi:ACT domain-containing protein [Luteimonas composti]|uniref:ACT domain-containing protein n=1 Tax=Luteimonas composti TaxID=398257 RepID=A0ABT6MQM9_9GAMM|nr:ACT domain-containing protein [Luteimonas composti]MDH7452947.1 ACT domain-containing protein [Luteimonas composti]